MSTCKYEWTFSTLYFIIINQNFNYWNIHYDNFLLIYNDYFVTRVLLDWINDWVIIMITYYIRWHSCSLVLLSTRYNELCDIFKKSSLFLYSLIIHKNGYIKSYERKTQNKCHLILCIILYNMHIQLEVRVSSNDSG